MGAPAGVRPAKVSWGAPPAEADQAEKLPLSKPSEKTRSAASTSRTVVLTAPQLPASSRARTDSVWLSGAKMDGSNDAVRPSVALSKVPSEGPMGEPEPPPGPAP